MVTLFSKDDNKNNYRMPGKIILGTLGEINIPPQNK